MDLQGDGRSFLDASANGRATLTTPPPAKSTLKLRIGDNELTASGEIKSIKFISRRKVSSGRLGHGTFDGAIATASSAKAGRPVGRLTAVVATLAALLVLALGLVQPTRSRKYSTGRRIPVFIIPLTSGSACSTRPCAPCSAPSIASVLIPEWSRPRFHSDRSAFRDDAISGWSCPGWGG